MNGCRYHPIPVAIILIYTLILYISTRLTRALGLGIPCVNLYGIPLSMTLMVPSLVVVKETIMIMGGPKEYFCSGAEIIQGLLRKGSRIRVRDGIIVAGPFSVTRHPVYTSTLLFTIALSVVLPCTLPAIILVAIWVYAASYLEERELSMSEEYREYRVKTPRFSLYGIVVYGYRRLLGYS